MGLEAKCKVSSLKQALPHSASVSVCLFEEVQDRIAQAVKLSTKRHKREAQGFPHLKPCTRVLKLFHPSLSLISPGCLLPCSHSVNHLLLSQPFAMLHMLCNPCIFLRIHLTILASVHTLFEFYIEQIGFTILYEETIFKELHNFV